MRISWQRAGVQESPGLSWSEKTSSSSVDRDVDMMATVSPRQQRSGIEFGGYHGHFDVTTWLEGSSLSRVQEQERVV